MWPKHRAFQRGISSEHNNGSGSHKLAESCLAAGDLTRKGERPTFCFTRYFFWCSHAACLWIHSFTVATWVDFGLEDSLYYVWDNWAYPNINSCYTFLKCFTRGQGIWRREKGWFRPEKCSFTACSQLDAWWAASNWKEGNKIIILP